MFCNREKSFPPPLDLECGKLMYKLPGTGYRAGGYDY